MTAKPNSVYKTTEYMIWENMIQRCCNPKSPYYSYYGGRGITICNRWRTFAFFRADMGSRPSPQHTIDRIDNSRGYSLENCRWTTRAEQQKNRRNARLITFQGRTETAHMWSKITGIPSRTIFNRLKRNWAPEAILTTPALGRGHPSMPQ